MKKRYLFGIAGVLGMVAAVAIAQTIPIPLVPAISPTVDLMHIVPNGTPAAGNVYATGRQVGQIGPGFYAAPAAVATATGTGEQVLATYSLPANALSYVGRSIRVHAAFAAGANGNNKTFKCYFGASVISSGVLTTNAKNGICDLWIVKTGASTQIVTGTMLVDTTAITPYVNAGTDADTAAIVIKMTGTDGTSSAADITMEQFFVEAVN